LEATATPEMTTTEEVPTTQEITTTRKETPTQETVTPEPTTSDFFIVLSDPTTSAVTTVSIDYTLIDGASQLFSTFNPTHSLVRFVNSQDILSHGCWCAKLARANSGNSELGGPKTTDVLDNICRSWIKARKCSEMVGACKNFLDFGALYDIQYTSGLVDAVCLNTENECLMESCEIDVSFVILVEEFMAENQGFVGNEEPDCVHKNHEIGGIFGNGGSQHQVGVSMCD